MPNLFDQTASTPETPVVEGSYVETLVGDGKKFKTVEDLARGKYESDTSFIPQLQNENAALRTRAKELEAQLQERITLEEFMNELKTPVSDDGVTNHQPQDTNVSPQIKPDDIGAIIDARLQEQEQRKAIQANVAVVQKSLADTWGTDWQNKLVAKAQDLNLSHEFLAGVAEKSPKAFLTLVLDKTESAPRYDPNSELPPRTQTTRVTPAQDVGARNKAYYDKLKQTNREMYYSPSVTQQRHRDAQRLGEAFFN